MDVALLIEVVGEVGIGRVTDTVGWGEMLGDRVVTVGVSWVAWVDELVLDDNDGDSEVGESDDEVDVVE